MSITKIELSELAYEHMSIDKRLASELVDMFFEELKNGLVKDKELQIAGFGKLTVKEKKERKGRNPQTGEQMAISARKIVSFHHSQVLKNRLNFKK